MRTPLDADAQAVLFQENARACRTLAKRMPAEQRRQLIELAELWEQMAAQELTRDLRSPPPAERH